jgi:hypothetical protein
MNNGYFRIPGSDTISIAYSVDGGASEVETLQLGSDLPPGQSVVLTFETGYDFSEIRSYEFQASVIWAMDENRSNNDLHSEVHVWTSPTVEIGGGLDTLVSDFPLTLDAGPDFSAYIWQDLSTASTYEVTTSGLYWVEAADEHGCSDRDSVYVASITSSGDVLTIQDQIRIYPNPASEVLFLAVDLDLEQELVVELYSISNALIFREELGKIKTSETRMNVQDLTPGTYFIRVSLDGKPYHSLVIIE